MRGYTEADHLVLADREVAERYELASRHESAADGLFAVGKPMSGIFCRPGCSLPAPRPSRTDFYPTAAAAHAAGLRPCPRCRPELAPRHPDHSYGDTLGARAIRLIDDGEIDRGGVESVARALEITSRHLLRVVTDMAGCGPLEVARAGRAQLARLVLSATAAPMEVVAVAAGFATVRQFNGTIREFYDCTPSDLRTAGGGRPTGRESWHGPLTVRCSLALRRPFDARALLHRLALRSVPETEEVTEQWYARVMRLPRGTGQVRIDVDGRGRLMAKFTVSDPRDLRPLYARTRFLLDLDALPSRTDRVLSADPLLEPLVRRHSGIRVAGAADPFEAVLRAVVDESLPPASARTLLGGLTTALGDPTPWGPAFPTAQRIAGEGRGVLRGDPRLIDAIVTLAAGVASGRMPLHRGMSRNQLHDLLAPSWGAAVADSAVTRILGERDVILAADDAVRSGARSAGLPSDPVALRWHAERWAPVRGYAEALLRAAATDPGTP